MSATAPQQTICERVTAVWPESRWSPLRVVVGVSGGADSVCLLRTLVQLALRNPRNLIVAHYDHQTRDDSSDDANFVRELALGLGLPFELGRSDSRDPSRSEAQLRSERYQFLDAAARRTGARYVAVAHTRDDQVETILHNVLRGTGGHGAQGIPAFRSLGEDLVLARPFLNVTRQEIEAALAAEGQSFRTDPSNAQPTWTRNWLRVELLPMLKTQFPQVDASLLRLGQNVGELQTAVDDMAKKLEAEAIDYQSSSARIAIDRVAQTPEAVKVSLLQRCWKRLDWPRGEMSHAHWKQLTILLCCADKRVGGARFDLPGHVHVSATERAVTLTRRGEDGTTWGATTNY